MGSWYNNIISSATTGITKLLDSEKDGDTDDDTLVCRVLRARYIARGSPFPPWLPPDPKAPAPVVLPPAPGINNMGGRYGYGQPQMQQPQQRQQQQFAVGAGSQANSKLGSLWDRGGGARSDSQPLGQGGGGGGGMNGGRNPFPRGASTNTIQQQSSMTLPLQSAGVGGGGGTAGSTGDRLRQRLRGGARTASPAYSGPYQPPPPQ